MTVSGRQQKRKLELEKIPNLDEFMKSQAPSTSVLADSNFDVEDHPYLGRYAAEESDKYPFGKTVYFETYGCQMNVNDTELAWTILKKAGFTKVDDHFKADVILIVTCSIREKAEDKIWKRLRKLKDLKLRDEARQYPKLGILGCMAERLKKKILDKEKSVDIIAGPDAYRDLPRLLEETATNSTQAINVMLSVDETYADIIPLRLNAKSRTAFVSIMRGCDNMCSYCIVPFTRGRERSRPVSSVVDEVRELSRQGVKQVTLLGQNVNSYRDLSDDNFTSTASNLSQGFKTIYKTKQGGMRFADLLDRVSAVDPEMRIRFTSPHPKDFPDEVLEIMRERANICKHIHLPAQSGSNNMLTAMRRGHTIEDYLKLVDRIRAYMPDVALSTDMISGFCGESEDDHQQTVDLMNRIKYNFAFLFKYSMRGKTHAYHRMKDDVSEATKQRRLAEVIEAYRSHLVATNGRHVCDTSHKVVLVEGVSPRSDTKWMGRDDRNIKCIVPHRCLPVVTSHDHQHVTEFKDIQVGDYVTVKFTDYHPNTYQCEPVNITTLS